MSAYTQRQIWSQADVKKMTDSEIAELIDLRRSQLALWDSCVSDYSNADVRKYAL